MGLSGQEWSHLLTAAGYGLVAGVIGAMSKARRVKLPRILVVRERDGSRSLEIDWGFVTSPLIGAVLAMMLDGNPQTAIAYGLAGGWVGPSIVNALAEAVLKQLGVRLEEHPAETLHDLPASRDRAVASAEAPAAPPAEANDPAAVRREGLP